MNELLKMKRESESREKSRCETERTGESQVNSFDRSVEMENETYKQYLNVLKHRT